MGKAAAEVEVRGNLPWRKRAAGQEEGYPIHRAVREREGERLLLLLPLLLLVLFLLLPLGC